MPNPADILSQKLEDDPDDQLREDLDQGQGENLAGGPQAPGPGGQQAPSMGSPQSMAPSPNVPGPLAALAPKKGVSKPHLKLISKRGPHGKPHFALAPKKKIKPHIKLKASAYGWTV